ncbi:hypothetical protein MAR_033476 [Mya arenaria]|uniref:EF-hand domain-containing protein n=1 Tax=Mya arenaria TaxID=6604 RepID=A0ABY7GBS0_MYAAR|nr:hypothetical protein MAR_033476 [Mya arenaria]
MSVKTGHWRLSESLSKCRGRHQPDIACMSVSRCDEGQREVVLFNKVDINHDFQLTRAELDQVFLLFDNDTDGEVTPAEFKADWVNQFNIGGPQEADTLFIRADTNDDGVIDTKDIPTIFAFFDENSKKTEDGVVDINEFLTEWGHLSLTAANHVDVSLLFVFAAFCLLAARCDEGQREVALFNKVDTNHDYQLTRAELDQVFLLFDNDSVFLM